MDNEFRNKLKNGNRTAWSAMYEQYADTLYAYGMKMAQNRELVNDCIQDLFIYLYDRRSKVPTLNNAQAYLLTCLKNKIYRQLSAQSKERSSVVRLNAEDWNDFNFTIDIPETMERTEFREDQLNALQEAINQLSPRQREILYLRYYKNLSVDEAAAVVGVSKQTVMNATSASLAKLRRNELLTKTFLMELIAFYEVFANIM